MSAPAPYQASGTSAVWESGLPFTAHGITFSFGSYVGNMAAMGYYGGICISIFMEDSEIDFLGLVAAKLAEKARDRSPNVNHIVGLEVKLDPFAVSADGRPGLLVEAAGTAADLRPLV